MLGQLLLRSWLKTMQYRLIISVNAAQDVKIPLQKTVYRIYRPSENPQWCGPLGDICTRQYTKRKEILSSSSLPGCIYELIGYLYRRLCCM